MRPLRNGDLSEIPGAAELIDSAQDAAKKLALLCAEKDAEIARLREAIKAFHGCWLRYPNYTEEYEEAVQALFKIAREGKE